jgi:hypothetical protein
MSDAGTAIFNNKVGIGVTPAYGLDLLGATNYKTVRIGQATATGTKRQAIAARHYTSSEQDHNMIGMFTDSNTNSILSIGGGLGSTGDFNSVTQIQLHTGNGTTVATTAAMTLDSSGNVGIGRTDPTQLLEVHKAAGGDQTVAKFSAHNYEDTGKTFIEIGTEYGDGSSRIGSFNDTGNKSVLIFETHSASSGQFTEHMRIKSDGQITTQGDILPGADVIMANGRGISFAATSNYSDMTSELLDDYEEGVYDATISCASGSITLYTSYTRLRYTKIGRQVHIHGKLAITSVSSPSGATNLNLPFASANDTNRSGVANNIMTGYFNGSAVTNGIYPIYGNIEEASSNCRLFIMIPPATNNLGDNHVAAGSDIHVNFTYTVQ